MARIFPIVTEYTDLDFDAVNERLKNILRSVFPTWTEVDVANFGNVLREMFGHVMDVLLFYMDNRADESRISTVQLRESILGLVKLIGFVPAGAVAAAVDVVITQTGATGTTTIPAEQLVRTASVPSPVNFRILGLLVIPAPGAPGGESSATVTAVNSEAREDLFDSRDVADQEFTLASTPFLDGSALVADGTGPYTEVENFLSSSATDKHFTVVVDENDSATIRFGDDRNGASPVGTISVNYRVGGGAQGTVEAGTVVTIPGSFTDEFGNPVVVSVTNPAGSSQGVDRASVAEIRVEAPESTRAPRRTVSREDFEIHAREVPGVGRALMLTSNELRGIAENTGQLYILPEGGGVATQDLLDLVVEKITVEKPHTLTFQPDVLTAPLLNVVVETSIHLESDTVDTEVRAAVVQSVTDYFDPTRDAEAVTAGERRVDFGFRFIEQNQDTEGKLPWSDVFNSVRDTTGVAKVDDGAANLLMNGVRVDLAIALNNFPVLIDVIVRNALTGTVIPES